MKRPAFQFYPGDWFRDTGLRSCSVAARGVWVDLLCAMHDGEPYGHLSVNGQPLTDQQAAKIVGVTPAVYRRCLAELERAGVSSRTPEGTLFSRRMVRDEEVRERRAAGGILGGNPALKDKGKVADKVNHTPNLQPTPASASAFASNSASTPRAFDGPLFAKLLNRMPDTGHGKLALTELLERLPIAQVDGWVASINAMLDGMHLPAGTTPTPEQMATACSDYVAAAPSTFSPAHFRKFVQRVVTDARRGVTDRRGSGVSDRTARTLQNLRDIAEEEVA